MSTKELESFPEAILAFHGSQVFPAVQSWRERDRVPPVLLLTGPSGVGKRELALYVSAWLLCEGFRKKGQSDPVAAGPCQKCGSCLRAKKESWVDLTEITAEQEEGHTARQGSIKIEQIDRLRATQGFGAREGAYRIILIRNAEQMTPQAANALLKILEEPPRDWIFLLTAGDTTLLLPTIVSRCQRWRLKPIPEELIQKCLHELGLPEDRLRLAAHLAQGSWKRAIAYAQDTFWEKRKQLLLFLENPQRELSGLVEWAAEDSASMTMLLDQLEFFSTHLVVRSADPLRLEPSEPLLHFAERSERVLGSKSAARQYFIDLSERANAARKRAMLPLNRKLFAQECLSPWLRYFD